MRDDSPQKEQGHFRGFWWRGQLPFGCLPDFGAISDGGIMLNPLKPQLNFQFFMVDSWG